MAPHAKNLTVSEPIRRLVVDAAQNIWNEIGYDCLQAMAEHGFRHPRDINTVTMTRTHVVEVVMDAGRLEAKLKATLQKSPPNPELFNLIRMYTGYDHAEWEMAHRAVHALVREAFPFARYGL